MAGFYQGWKSLKKAARYVSSVSTLLFAGLVGCDGPLSGSFDAASQQSKNRNRPILATDLSIRNFGDTSYSEITRDNNLYQYMLDRGMFQLGDMDGDGDLDIVIVNGNVTTIIRNEIPQKGIDGKVEMEDGK